MKLQLSSSGEFGIRLAGGLDLYTAEAAREALLHHLAEKAALELDLGQLETCDVAGLQVLLAARRTARAAARAFVIRVPSSAVEACGALVGVSSEDLSPVTP